MWYLPGLEPSAHMACAVLLVVLITRLGAPIPAAPLLILGGTICALGQASYVAILASAISAAMLADSPWFLMESTYGKRLANSLVRFSLSLDNAERVRAIRSSVAHRGETHSRPGMDRRKIAGYDGGLLAVEVFPGDLPSSFKNVFK